MNIQRRVGVAIKLLAVTAAIVVIIVGAQTWLNLQSAGQREAAEAEQRLGTLYTYYTDRATTMRETAATLALSFADRPDVQERVAAQDRPGLLALLAPLYSILKVDHHVAQFNLVGPTGVVLARVSDPPRFGDDVTYRRTIAAALSLNQTVAGLEIGPNRLGVRAVSPVFHAGRFIGLVEVGLDYDQFFIQDLKASTGADYALWIAQAAAAPAGLQPGADAPAPPIPELFYYAGTRPPARLVPQDAYRRVLTSGQLETHLVSDGRQDWAVLVAPLLGYENRVLGVLEIVSSRAGALAALRRDQATTLAVAGGLALLAFTALWLATRWAVLNPLDHLAGVAGRQLAGDMAARVKLSTGDEFEQLGATLNTLTHSLASTLAGLEQRVAERTRDVERRSTYLEASAEVSRAAAAILETDRLIRRAVELIREHFGLYYVGLFLVDEAGEWAVLRAGVGAGSAAQAGDKMLARGHRIQVGEGMIGWCIAHAQPRIAQEAGQDAVRLATAELPETRSEAALPLRSRGQVIGALSVQSAQPDAFDQDALAALQTMADQVAIALDNARLLAASRAALEAAHRAYGEVSRRAWSEQARARPGWGYRYTRRTIAPVEGDWRPEMLQALQSGQSVSGADLAVPIQVRDQVIGALRFSKGAGGGAWTSEDITLLEALAEQLGVALESARLFQDTQRRAAREKLISEVTARVRETLDIETILKTAAQQVRQSLDLPQVVIRLRSTGPAPASAAVPGGGEIQQQGDVL